MPWTYFSRVYILLVCPLRYRLMEMTAGGLVSVSDKMGGGQGSARKLQSDAVGEMEGQTQTEEERDERRQEGVMEA